MLWSRFSPYHYTRQASVRTSTTFTMRAHLSLGVVAALAALLGLANLAHASDPKDCEGETLRDFKVPLFLVQKQKNVG